MTNSTKLFATIVASALVVTARDAQAQYACIDGKTSTYTTSCRIGSATFSDWSFSGTAPGSVTIRPFTVSFSPAGNIGFWVDGGINFSTATDTPLGSYCGAPLNGGAGSGFCLANPPGGSTQTYVYYRKTITVGVTVTPDVPQSMFISAGQMQTAGATQWLDGLLGGGSTVRADWMENGSPATNQYTTPSSLFTGYTSTFCLSASCAFGNGPRPTSPFRFTQILDFYYQVPTAPNNNIPLYSANVNFAVWWAGENLYSVNPLPPDPTPVPEPSVFLLSFTGLAGLLLAGVRRRSPQR